MSRVSLNEKVSGTVNGLISNNNDVNKDNNNVKDNDTNNIVNNNVNRNVNVDSDIDNNKNVSNGNNNSDDTKGKFVLEVKKKQEEELKRGTYYLKPDTIKQIERISKKVGMGKSELVQKILEESLKNIEIKE